MTICFNNAPDSNVLRHFLRVATLLSVVLATAIVGWALLSNVTSRRFQLDVELLVDGNHYFGQTVWEMKVESQYNPLGNSLPFKTSAQGDALAIPINETETIFVLEREQSAGTNEDFGALPLYCDFVAPNNIQAFDGPCDVRVMPEMLMALGAPHSAEVPKLVPVRTALAGDTRIEVVSINVRPTDQPLTSGLAAQYPWIRELETGERRFGSAFEVHYPEKYYRADFTLRW